MEEGEKERAIYLGAAASLAFPPLPPISSSCQKILLYYGARTDLPSLSPLRRCHIIQKNKSAIKWGGNGGRLLSGNLSNLPLLLEVKKLLQIAFSKPLSFLPFEWKTRHSLFLFLFCPPPSSLFSFQSIAIPSSSFLASGGRDGPREDVPPLFLYSAGSERTGKGFTHNFTKLI